MSVSALRSSWRALTQHRSPESVLGGLPPDHQYLFLERYFNPGSPSGHLQTTSPAYAPSASSSDYELPLVQRRGRDCTVIGTTALLPGYETVAPVPPDTRLVPIHPDFLGSEAPVQVLNVVPTASGRTVAVVGEDGRVAGWLKLDYPAMLGRSSRRLSPRKWLSSFEIATRLLAIDLHGFSIVNETFGLLIDDERSWGIHGREFPSGDGLVVPAFSLLFSKDGGFPIVEYLASIVGDAELAELPIRLVDAYFTLALEHALMPECNAQNVLFLVENGQLSVVFRDLEDVFKDLSQARDQGLPTFLSEYKSVSEETGDLYQRRSFSFDFKLGEYLLSPLATAFGAVGVEDPTRLAKKVRQAVSSRLRDQPGYFGPSPELWYRYPSGQVGRLDYVRETHPQFR